MQKFSKINSVFLFLLLFIFPATSCNDNNTIIPYVYVNFYIDLNNPEYYDLNAIGNSVHVTGGVKGIIIYRKSIDEYLAFDRTCTYDPNHEWGKVVLDENMSSAMDTVCGSEFSFMLDGAAVGGPAAFPLQQYNVLYDESNNLLYISN